MIPWGMSDRSIHLMLLLCVAVAVLCGACDARRLSREALPYRFGQSMLDDPEAPSRPRQAQRRRRARPRERLAVERRRRAVVRRQRAVVRRRRAVVRRGEALIGRPFASDEALIAAALGRPLARRARQRWHQRPAPQPADLVAFSVGKRAKLGLVIAREGPRLTFIHLLGGRARRGWLHLQQPHRRRLPGDDRVANSFIRPRRPDDPPGTRYLAGQLLRGFSPAT